MTNRDRAEQVAKWFGQFKVYEPEAVDAIERAIDAAVREAVTAERLRCEFDVFTLVNDEVLARIVVDAFNSRGAR